MVKKKRIFSNYFALLLFRLLIYVSFLTARKKLQTVEKKVQLSINEHSHLTRVINNMYRRKKKKKYSKSFGVES